jgi:hypothetical protein
MCKEIEKSIFNQSKLSIYKALQKNIELLQNKNKVGKIYAFST